jgi:hypothetical protein
MGGGTNMKPGIIDFNEENVATCFIDRDGQLMIPKKLHQLLEQ